MDSTIPIGAATGAEQPTDNGYGRARLLLGVTGVGAWVVLAFALLAADAPRKLDAWLGSGLVPNALAVIGMVLAYVVLHAILDLFGGHVLPRTFGRSRVSLRGYAPGWLRGVAVHALLLALVGLAMLLAGRGPGVPGMVIIGAASLVLMLTQRTTLAGLMGSLSDPTPAPDLTPADGPDVALVASNDVGFTGGVEGVLTPQRILLPSLWVDRLAPEVLALAIERRAEAVRSGLWRRGRWLAILFTLAGMGVAGGQVGALAGTAGGVLVFSAVFTLWSFAGLLLLPTLTRRASHALDQRLIASGVRPEDLEKLARELDAMQDTEPSRPGWIETVFHTIPNVEARTTKRANARVAGYDTARTAAFLSIAGLGMLSRAVHCNCGRPALWCYYPLD